MVGRALRLGAALGLLAAFTALSSQGCATIEVPPPGTCGNAVVDTITEDCDGYPRLDMPCRAAGEEGECRFDCRDTLTCKLGYGCGSDGICRTHSGSFVSAAQPDEDAVTLLPRDFDGDGVPDLLVGSDGDPVLLFLQDDFAIELDVDLLTPVGAALIAAADLTGDGTPDLAFPSGNGIQVLRGGDREFSGTAYATFTIPNALKPVVAAFDAETERPGDEALAVIELEATFVLLADANLIDSEVVQVLTEIDTLPPLIDGDALTLDKVAAGQLDPATPCDDYVLAFRNADRVVIGTPFTQENEINGGPFDPGDPPTIPIGTIDIDLASCGVGFQVASAFVIDSNGDGQDDVVVTPEVSSGGSPSRACIATGPFEFEDPPQPAVTPQASPYAPITLEENERVFVVDYINADAQLDIVSSSGIFLSTASCPGGFRAGGVLCNSTPGVLGSSGLAEAVLGDFNGDELRDVAAVDGVSDLLFVYLAHENDTFAEFRLEPDGYATKLGAGDFDGDGVTDIAFADRSCQSCPIEEISDGLAISFGAVSGGPEAPRSFGQLGHIEQIAAASFPQPEAALDGAQDLGVLFTDAAGPEFRFATLFGSTRRDLQAPFVIVTGTPPEPQLLYQPVQVVIAELSGDTSEDGARKDLAVFAFHDAGTGEPIDMKADMQIWLLQAEGEAELSGSRTWSSGKLELWDDWDPGYGFAVAGNLDPGGRDELVYTGGHGLMVATVVHVEEQPTIETSWFETEEAFYSTATQADDSVELGPLGGPATLVPLVLGDIDRDDDDDLVALGMVGDQQMLVVFFSTDGQLSNENKASMALTSPTRGLALASLDADGAFEIILADEAGGSFIDLDGDILSQPRPLLGLGKDPQAARTVTAADIDRDGVADLVLGHEQGMSLYRGIAELP